ARRRTARRSRRRSVRPLGRDSSDAATSDPKGPKRALTPPPRAELPEPRERAQGEPERREKAVEEHQGDGEGRVPERPPPARDRRLRLQRAAFFFAAPGFLATRALFAGVRGRTTDGGVPITLPIGRRGSSVSGIGA